MANKFTEAEPQEPGTDLVKVVQMGMDGGFRGDVSPRSIQPGETPVLDDVRFERTAIRKDFGWQAIGLAAAFPVLGLIEHKFISEGLEFQRLVRVFQDAGGFAAVEVWDGADWILVNTSAESINAVYLSMISAQGALYFSEGSQILCWLEDLAPVLTEQDWPGSNALNFEGRTTELIVSPGFVDPVDYTIAFRVNIFIKPETSTPTTVLVQFLHEGTSLGTALFTGTRNESYPLLFDNELFVFNRQIDDGDELQIKVLQVTSGDKEEIVDNSPIGPGLNPPADPTNIILKTRPNSKANGDIYEIVTVFIGGNLDSSSCFATLEYFLDDGDGIFVSLGTEQFQGPTLGARVPFTLPGLDVPNVRFGVTLISQIGGCGAAANFSRAVWVTTNASIEVHGNNQAINMDTLPGLSYSSVSGSPQSTLTAIDPGPSARYIIHFARRIIALQDMGDRQVFSFSADGLLTDFTTIELGAGQLFLVDTRSDAIDALQGGAVLNSNFLAVFRQRSIMRAFESGNAQQAIGVVSWIENLGTNAPFSIRNVLGGTMFLGHDNMVYFLTEQGPRAVGLPIHQEIIEDLTGDLDLVDSAWDPTFGEYYLGIPVGPTATVIDKVWVFDVDRFLKTQETVWRRKPMDVQRFATAGISEVI